MHRKICLGASAIAIALAASPVLAQGAPQADAGAGASADVGGDIIVTAQRRSERLRDVPIAVTALSGEALERLHANNISRVEFATPGFTWGSQGSDSFPAIRGVRTSLVSAQTDPVIGFYVDGIYQSRTQQQSIPLFDVARVEVLRGPQGTLYGRNTFGGNISVVTSDPTKDLGAGINIDKGNFNSARIDGYVIQSIPDVGGVLNPLMKEVVRQPGAWFGNFNKAPVLWLIPALAYVGAIGALVALRVGRTLFAFVGSSLACLSVILTAGVALFPFVLPSSELPKASLTAWDATSSYVTLNVMLWVALIFTPIVLAYTGWAYRVMAGTVTRDYIKANDKALY